MMKCTKCNHEYADNLKACPLCGEPQVSSRVDNTTSSVTEPIDPFVESRDYESPRADSTPPHEPETQPVPPVSEPQATSAEAVGNLPPRKGFAITALVLGIVSILLPFLGLLCGIVAIVFGHLARKSAPPGTSVSGMATAGLVTGIVGVVIQGIFLAIVIGFAGMVITIGGSVIDALLPSVHWIT